MFLHHLLRPPGFGKFFGLIVLGHGTSPCYPVLREKVRSNCKGGEYVCALDAQYIYYDNEQQAHKAAALNNHVVDALLHGR